MNKFFVIRKDGTLASASASLGGALDYMGNGRLLYMGTPTEAVVLMKRLGHSEVGQKDIGPGTGGAGLGNIIGEGGG